MDHISSENLHMITIFHKGNICGINVEMYLAFQCSVSVFSCIILIYCNNIYRNLHL